MAKNRLRVIPLGGAGEVGRNMWVLECGEEILLLDCGVMFPEAEMLGVDLVLPDITYLQDKKDQIKALLLTHGHEDHIGAVPHLLAELGFPPIYGTPLTIGMVTGKLKGSDLLAALERVLTPRPDPGQRAAAQKELIRRLVGVVSSLARGEPPQCAMAHAIVRHGGDLGAALAEILHDIEERARR